VQERSVCGCRHGPDLSTLRTWLRSPVRSRR
jgi:hypothetical protein